MKAAEGEERQGINWLEVFGFNGMGVGQNSMIPGRIVQVYMSLVSAFFWFFWIVLCLCFCFRRGYGMNSVKTSW